MKDFRKTKEGLFICEECGTDIKSRKGFANHLRHKHYMTSKNYIDKWLKEQNDGKCKICGKQTSYSGLSEKYFGYKLYCSNKCSEISEEKVNKVKRTNLFKLNVEYSLQSKKIINKSRKTKIEKYGNEKYNNIIKNKNTKLKRYKNEKYNNQEKYKQTCLEKYGVEHPMQNTDVFSENQLSGFKAKRYKNLYYRGTYELDFLEKFYDKIDIENGPSIPYVFNGKNKVYHPDFYIPSLNLVVEIKSTYYRNLYGLKNKEKEKATIFNGYKYIIIIDKDYNIFEDILLEFN